MDNNKKKNLLIIAVIGAAILLFIVWFVNNRVTPGTTSYTIKVSPVDTAMTLDGKPVKAGTITVKQGKHTLAGSRKDFTSATKVITTDNDLPDTTIFLILDPATDEARQYLATHLDEQNIREGASDTKISKDNDTLIKNYPFIQYLPYETLDYDIEYHTNKDLTVELDVTLNPVTNPADTASYKEELLDYQKEANDYMRNNGIDTSKVKVNWSPDPAKL